MKVTMNGLGQKTGCKFTMTYLASDGRETDLCLCSSDVAGDMIGATGFDYLVVDGHPPQILIVYREFNDLEFSYELGQYICFQRNNQTRCT